MQLIPCLINLSDFTHNVYFGTAIIKFIQEYHSPKRYGTYFVDILRFNSGLHLIGSTYRLRAPQIDIKYKSDCTYYMLFMIDPHKRKIFPITNYYHSCLLMDEIDGIDLNEAQYLSVCGEFDISGDKNYEGDNGHGYKLQQNMVKQFAENFDIFINDIPRDIRPSHCKMLVYIDVINSCIQREREVKLIENIVKFLYKYRTDWITIEILQVFDRQSDYTNPQTLKRIFEFVVIISTREIYTYIERNMNENKKWLIMFTDPKYDTVKNYNRYKNSKLNRELHVQVEHEIMAKFTETLTNTIHRYDRLYFEGRELN